ncbi:Epithelial splicing regulatory protein 1 [Paragonimus skrjabini miyazakii]|uniref:Epithelial splicing regulatory protein 1 n=1 Tax=Paragonimus skrjabini miyazakii TaxID=59628 RepID=A0A8S9YY71_9TREM|nr:Epithelial splicing regulatory protein 1 [Paragonimus skrjabini miyazakii]
MLALPQKQSHHSPRELGETGAIGIKRPRFSEYTGEDCPNEVRDGHDRSVHQQDNSPESVTNQKRPRLDSHAGLEPNVPDTGLLNQTFTHWIAFDLVTAGRQVDLRPESFIRIACGPVESTNSTSLQWQEQSSMISKPSDQLRPDDVNLNGQFGLQNVISFPADSQTGSTELENCRPLVPLSLDAMAAARWHEASQLPGPTSPSLPEAMNKFANWLHTHNVTIDEEPKSSTVLLITDGHLAVRNVLHPQAAYLGLDRSQKYRNPWCSYLSVLDWCRHCGEPEEQVTKSPTNLTEAATVLGMQGFDSTELQDQGPTKVEQIASLCQTLITKGVPIGEPQIIRTVYEHHVFSRKAHFEDNCIVEVRQVPWSATPAIIAGFFSGLNLAPGGVAIRLTDGRRSNTAIVAFESALDAQLALARHQHQLCGALFPEPTHQDGTINLDKTVTRESQIQSHVKPTVLQVYSASGREFVQCAGCDQPPVAEFLNQLTNGEQVVVRVRGLPYTASKQQIVEFFAAVQAPVLFDSQGIYLVAFPEGRPTGDAFVLFEDDRMATRALLRHKDYLGDRYVELFKASPSEMVQVCFNVSQQQQQQHGASNGPKTQSTTTVDPQVRARQALSLGVANLSSLNPYLFQTPKVAATDLASLKTTALPAVPLPTNLYQPEVLLPSLGLFTSLLPSTMGQWDSLGLTNALGMLSPQQLASCLSRQTFNQLLNSSNLFGSVTNLGALRCRPLSTSENSTATQDLKDPTDPDCPYARQLPPNGVTAMIQLSGLPLDTLRHDIRLYLGPGNMAKVYRMRKMDSKPDQTTASWLISVSNTTEAIHLIRDLVNRPFSTTNSLSARLGPLNPNIPTFALYHVGADKTPIPIPLTDPSVGIPFSRIYGMCPEPQPSENWTCPGLGITSVADSSGKLLVSGALHPTVTNTTNHLSSDASTGVTSQLLPSELVQNRLVQTMLNGTPLTLSSTQPSSYIVGGATPTVQLNSGIPQPSLSISSHPIGSGPSGAISYQFQSNPLVPIVANNPNRLATLPVSNLSNTTSCSANSSSIVMLTGVPLDATVEELTSLFHPIGHLLSSSPQFTLYQAQPNGTANVLATFNNPLEAQAAALYCPSGSLRNNQYAVGAAYLAPPVQSPTISSTLLEPMAPTQFGNPLTIGTTSGSLMFLTTPMSNNSLLH